MRSKRSRGPSGCLRSAPQPSAAQRSAPQRIASLHITTPRNTTAYPTASPRYATHRAAAPRIATQRPRFGGAPPAARYRAARGVSRNATRRSAALRCATLHIAPQLCVSRHRASLRISARRAASQRNGCSFEGGTPMLLTKVYRGARRMIAATAPHYATHRCAAPRVATQRLDPQRRASHRFVSLRAASQCLSLRRPQRKQPHEFRNIS